MIGGLIALSVVTGAYLAWRQLGEYVTALSGAKAIKTTKAPKGDEDQATTMPLDDMVARAQAEFPDDWIDNIQIPADPVRPIRIRMRLADDPHPLRRIDLSERPEAPWVTSACNACNLIKNA